MITDQFGKKWYKGNLHTHSTNSDGRLSPEEVIGLYREEGYDFLALQQYLDFSCPFPQDPDGSLVYGRRAPGGKFSAFERGRI